MGWEDTERSAFTNPPPSNSKLGKLYTLPRTGKPYNTCKAQGCTSGTQPQRLHFSPARHTACLSKRKNATRFTTAIKPRRRLNEKNASSDSYSGSRSVHRRMDVKQAPC